MAWLQIAGAIVAAAAGAYLDHLRDVENETARNSDRQAMLDAIERLRAEAVTIEVNQLQGELEGFRLTYGAYEPNPNDQLEEQRLLALIDDSARVIGRLGAHVESVATVPDLAFASWPIYVSLLYLRAQALNEREVTFGAAEKLDALPAFDAALPRLNGLLSELRRQSNRRFGKITCKPFADSQDPRVCWYEFFSGKVVVVNVCGSLKYSDGMSKCEARRTSDMERRYRTFPAVAQIGVAFRSMQAARDELETVRVLNQLADAGVDIRADILVKGGEYQMPSTLTSLAARKFFHRT